MKTWIVRFASLYVFNVVLLLLIGLFTPAQVGWAALWGSVVLTAATLWLKPLIAKMFSGAAKKSSGQRTAFAEKLVQYGIVFVVELLIWILVVSLSGISSGGWFWGWVLPPVILAIGWIVYDLIDDRVHAHAGELYDRAQGGIRGSTETPATPSAAAREGQEELKDGLTAEQRRMLDELGS